MLRVENLSCGILRDIHIHVAPGESVAIVGESGSGKTTLLNAIAGYLPCRGHIRLRGKSLDALPPWQRNCRYLNQRLYLFPHLTVGDNLALARNSGRAAQLNLLAELKIAHLIDRRPAQLSGGEQQRAALARLLISTPDIALLDEPFSALDWQTREHLWALLARLKREHAMTILLVTHEPREAQTLADRSLTLHHGQLITQGTPP